MKKTLVTAATGNVGTPLVNALQQKNMDFTAATRDAAKARDLLGESVDTVFMDYEEPDSFGPAVKRHNLLFLCGPSGTPNAPDLMMPMIEEAQKHNIEHVVFISSHPTVADAIKASEMDYTFINANFFMQNFEMYQTDDIRDRQQIFLPCGDGKASFVHARDIGEVAAEILENPDQYRQKTLAVTGPESLDLFEAAKVFADVLGEKISYKNPDDESYRAELERRGREDAYIDAMIKVFGKIKAGDAAGTSPTVEQLLGRFPLTLKDYVRDEKMHFQSKS